MANRWLQDDDLPTWAHTTCVLSIVSLFALPLIWSGLKAITLQSLPPMMGPEFGVWMFGSRELQGRVAVLAGLSLMVFGATFFALGVTYTRWAQDRVMLRRLPWLLLVLGVVLYFWVLSRVKA